MEIGLEKSKSGSKETNDKGVKEDQAKDKGGLNQDGRTGEKLTNIQDRTLIYTGKINPVGICGVGLGEKQTHKEEGSVYKIQIYSVKWLLAIGAVVNV